MILVAGIVFVVNVLLLPEVDASEDVAYSGPQIPYGTSKYVVNGYYFPPIPKGQVISIGITGFTPSDLLVTFYPQGGQQFGYPVLSVIPKNGSYSTSFLSPDTQPYALIITSFNGTGFILGLHSVWSPFYFLRIYSAEAALVMLIGLGASYYYHERTKRELVEESATKRANQGESSAQGQTS